MINKFSHYSYVPGWIRYSENQGEVIMEGRADYFLGNAISEALFYDEKERLLFCIENGLPELWESEVARKFVAELVQSGGIAMPGHYPKTAKGNAQRNVRIWKRVHYWQGRGLPIKSSSKESACDRAGADIGRSPSTVYDIWRKMGGNNPSTSLKLVAMFYKVCGETEQD